MKKVKITIAGILFLFFSSAIFAQQAGDFRSAKTTAGTYGWNVIANWETHNGSTWKPATGLPTSASNVTIRSGSSAVYVVNDNASAKNLTVESGGIIQFWNTFQTTLTVNGDINVNGTINTFSQAPDMETVCTIKTSGNLNNNATGKLLLWDHPEYFKITAVEIIFNGSGNSNMILKAGSTTNLFEVKVEKSLSTEEVIFDYQGGTLAGIDGAGSGFVNVSNVDYGSGGVFPYTFAKGIFRVSGSTTYSSTLVAPAYEDGDWWTTLSSPYANGVDANASLIIDNPNFTMTFNPANTYVTWQLYGTLDIKQCAGVTIGQDDNTGITSYAGSTLRIQTSTVKVGGGLYLEGAYEQTGGILIPGTEGAGMSDRGLFTCPGTSFTMSGGQIRLENQSYTTPGKPLFYSNSASSVNITGGTLWIGGTDVVSGYSGNQQTFSISGITPSIDFYKDVTYSNNAMMWGNVTCYGTINLPAGCALSLYNQDSGNLPYTFTLKGNTFTHAGKIFGEVANSKILFNGSAAQTFNSTGTFQNTAGLTGISKVEINNASGVNLAGTNNLEIPVNLTLTSGVLNTGSLNLQLDENATATRTGGYVQGTYIKKYNTGAQAFTYHTGTANGYSPAGVSFGNITAGGSLTTTVAQVTHPNAPIAAEAMKRYWTFTNSGIVFDNYDATFTYLPDDFNTSFAENTEETAMNWKKWNGAWTFLSVGTRTPGGAADGGTIQVTGLTAFSDFTGSKPIAPVADFSSSSQSFCSSACIDFTDNSINYPTSWEWTFDGGTPGTSTLQNPTNICYNTPGTYDVILKATNIAGNDTKTKVGYITVKASSVAPTGITATENPLCPGNPSDLSVTGGSLGDGADWQWYETSCGGTSIGSGSSITVTKSPAPYFVRAEGTCNTTACVKIDINLPTPVLTSSDIRYNRAVLDWSNFCPGAVSYRIYWRNQAEPTAAGALIQVVNGQLPTTLLIQKLAANTRYYWKVQAEDMETGWGPYSDSVYFDTPMPTLTNSEITFNKAKFSWTPVVGATGYRIKYYTGSNITLTPIISSTKTDTVISTLLPGSLYKWQIGAIYAPGEYVGLTPAALAAQFTTSAVPVKSTNPVNFNRAVLSWTAVPGATQYLIKYTFGTTTATKLSPTNTMNFSGLTPNTLYTWSINPDYGSGWTTYTPSSNFTTSAEPNKSTNPVNFNQAKLNWDAIPGATNYTVTFYWGTSFSTRITTNNYITLNSLLPNTNYTWKVMPDYGSGWTSYTSTSGFNTGAPVLTTNSTGVTTAALSWTGITGATMFAIKYHPTGFPIPYSTKYSAINSINLTGLTGATNYTWYVNPNYGSGYTTFSPSATFLTATPKLVNPDIDITQGTEDLYVFPNPASEVLNIKYKVQNEENQALYAIYNSIGESVLKGYVLQEEFQLNISRFSKGIYFVKVVDGTEIKIQKIVIE